MADINFSNKSRDVKFQRHEIVYIVKKNSVKDLGKGRLYSFSDKGASVYFALTVPIMASPGCSLEIQNVGPHPRPADSESAFFSQDPPPGRVVVKGLWW